VHYPEVGHFEASLFDPKTWKPNYPNLAFEEMDESDAYWGAKIVTAFTDEHIRALASAGQYSRPEVTRYVEDTFRKRRDAIGAYWFSVVSPLEDFELDASRSEWTLKFRDLGVERGYAAENRGYRLVIREASKLQQVGDGASEAVGQVEFRPPAVPRTGAPDRYGRSVLFVVDVSSTSAGSPALPVRLFVGRDSTSDAVEILGWRHAPK
jgi:hypothetical protein